MKRRKVRLPEYLEEQVKELKYGQDQIKDALKTLNLGLDTLLKGMVTLVEQIGAGRKDYFQAPRPPHPPHS